MKLSEVMKKPIFVSPDDTLEYAAKVISKTNNQGLLVGSTNQLKGVVTKEDLVKHFGHKERVSEIMTKNVIVVQSDDSPEKVIKILKKNRINFVPVFTKKSIVGVVSSKDFLTDNEQDEKEFLFD